MNSTVTERRTGMGSHQSTVNVNDEWLTPRWLLERLDPFDTDPCACSPPRPWPTAAQHITKNQDGLRLPWHGRVWLNPPYGGPAIIGPWLRRIVSHDNGIALIFARTETDLFFKTVWEAATAILFLRGRLHFCRRDGSPARDNAGAPSCLVAYGSANAAVLERGHIPGAFVRLRP